MGRKPTESDQNRWAILMLVLMALMSCTLVYMGLSYSFRPTFSSISATERSLRQAGANAGEGDDCCRGIENLELWGSAVKWGADFKLNSSHDCCRACKAMCSSDGPCLCNSWVFCGDRAKCGDKLGECWLKKQKDPFTPDLREAGENVIWTSGLVFENGEGIVSMETEYGVMRIRLFPDCAPRSVAYIMELLQARHCAGCQFYRAEGRGNSWDSKGNHIQNAPLGPPFALIQGTLEAGGVTFKEIPKEACPNIRRGSVAWVGSGPEFFISLANHDEWKHAYTVFGSILQEDMEVAEKIVRLPSKSDVWGKISVSVLEKPVDLWLKRAMKMVM